MPTKKELVTEAENLGIEVKSSMNKAEIESLIDAVRSENKTVVDDVFVDESEPEEIIEEKEPEEDLPEEPEESKPDYRDESKEEMVDEPIEEPVEEPETQVETIVERIKDDRVKEDVNIPIKARNSRRSLLSRYFPKKSKVLKKYYK